MFEPISMTLMGISAIALNTRSSSAVSAEARETQRATAQIAFQTEQSEFLFGAKAAVLRKLRLMVFECSENGWDGDCAQPLSPIALANADAFIRALPSDFPLPECAPEPDGAISLDWIVDSHRMISLSLSESQRIAYAWLEGSDKGHAVARFNGSSIPPRILQSIQSTLGLSHASLRIA